LARQHGFLWGGINTLLETGLEIYGQMEAGGGKGAKEGAEVEPLAEGVLLMSNGKEILLAVGKETAGQVLSEQAKAYGADIKGHLCYPGAMAAIPLIELSRHDPGIQRHIVSGESLRATLCGNYPEYVEACNMSAPPGARIEGADAPQGLFLQKQLDNAADSTRSEAYAFQEAHSLAAEMGGRLDFDNEALGLER